MLGKLLLYTVLTLLFFSIYLAYIYIEKRLKYWKKRNVPYLKPVPILGNFADYILFKKYIGHVVQDLCQKFPDAPFFGAFFGTEPTLVVKDPEIIKLILTKDYNFFSGRENLKYSEREMLAQNLFFIYGDRWKLFRKNLSSIFSTAKMKNMFHLIESHSRVFEHILDEETKTSDVIEVKSLMARYTLDCICSCAFGVDPQALAKKEDNPFKATGETIFDSQYLRAFKNISRTIWPAIFYGLGLQMFPKKLETFFYNLLTGVFKGRHYKATNKNDFVDLLLKLREQKQQSPESFDGLEINDEMLVAQCFIFFAAGFDTSANTSSFTLFELAKNPQAQEIALEEVDAYLRRHDNVLEYECLTEMPYLEACMDEALRLYPVLATLRREVTEDYTLPDGLKLEKGLRIHIPLYHLQHSPEHFPEPEQYRPERFLDEEKRMIKPYTYMPFGEGPRICIGYTWFPGYWYPRWRAVFGRFESDIATGGWYPVGGTYRRGFPYRKKKRVALISEDKMMRELDMNMLCQRLQHSELYPLILLSPGLRFAKMQMIAGLITLLKKYRVELAQGMERKVEFEPKALITYPIGGINLKFIEREGWKDRLFQSPKSKVSS